ncbi:uncharacterized protein LOC119657727 isoform X2 [Hermetia illucens]|uniref:uncharacterized protein LOC119657727 isoform X2 n=1 Tax=Hermetia illucens TaxID=343691 RepID=UPI0018CBF764|nr:uncharacterized protein LOC119657727 isoform X2 [Hermetia illucens]
MHTKMNSPVDLATVNPTQKEFLLSYMSDNKDLFRGFVGQPGKKEEMEENWDLLAQELNKLGPPKTKRQWKIYWKTLKNNLKLQRSNRLVPPRQIKSGPASSGDSDTAASYDGSVSANSDGTTGDVKLQFTLATLIINLKTIIKQNKERLKMERQNSQNIEKFCNVAVDLMQHFKMQSQNN